MNIRRNRYLYFLIIILVVVLGLFSRTKYIPDFIYPYLGDFLYCLMFYFILGFLFPKKKIVQITLISILICFLIEFQQLYQTEWIKNIRSHRLGGLILGHGFLWSDLISYALGGLFGGGLEYLFYQKNK